MDAADAVSASAPKNAINMLNLRTNPANARATVDAQRRERPLVVRRRIFAEFTENGAAD